MPKKKSKKKTPAKKEEKYTPPTKVFGIRLRPHEREKFDKYIENSPFNTIADFAREAMNSFIAHPEVRDPTIQSRTTRELYEEVSELYDRQEEEQQAIIEAITHNKIRLNTLERKIDLLLEKMDIPLDEFENDEELIFDEEE